MPQTSKLIKDEPDRTTVPATPASGLIRRFWRNGNFAFLRSNGVEVTLAEDTASDLFLQQNYR